MKSLSPDFFIFNGDQIYADNSCSTKGPNSNDNVKGWKNIPQYIPSVTANGTNWENLTELNNIFKLHWEYNRNDTHLKSLLGNTSIYSQADDLEVVNDYGNWSYWTASTKDRSGFPNVAKAGIQAFFNFSPIERNIDEPYRIYRSFNWGKDLDLFILDAHSYRSRSELDDTSSNNKPLLGNTQLRWLEKGLATSNATWKVISGDVPITIPNCFNKQLGCDNWATNISTYQKTFVRERSNFLKYLDDHNIKNVVFITTDVTFSF